MVASPQAENGHIDIANEIAEALMKINLSPYESRVLWFLFRKTYGWHKKRDWITLSQFSKCIELDRRLIHRAIKGLSYKNMVIISKDDNNHITYGFQKNYKKWKVSSKKMTVIGRDDGLSSVEMTKVSSVEIPTKETITKETITKDTKKFILPDWIPKETWNAYLEIRNKKRAAKTDYALSLIIKELVNIKKWYGHDPIEVLNKSIKSGWTDVYPLKEKQPTKGDNRGTSDQQESERILQAANKRFREEIAKRSAASKDRPDA